MENKYYLYRHIRLDKNEPFYIGIGTKSNRQHPNIKSEYKRAYEINRKESYIWNNIVSKTEYEIEILFESNDYNFIKEKEKEFIKLYGRINKNSGCLSNMTDGGDGTIGYIPSKEQVENHRNFLIGRKQSEETKQKRLESRRGYKHSEETRVKISNSHKGKKTAKEHLEKLYKGQIIANSKPILQYDLDGNLIKEWQSATIASKEFGLHPTSIRHCVQGKTKTSGGFIWKPQNSYK
jgi:NUMOD3 motif